MTGSPSWRGLTVDESAIVTAFVSRTEVPGWQQIVEKLDGARVRQAAPWILDIDLRAGPRIDVPNGPLPVRAYVQSEAAYQGEIIVWIADGYVCGLEYAWVTDAPPSRWPHPDEMEIVRG